MIFPHPFLDPFVKRTPTERILEVFSLLALLGAFVPLLFYASLGEEARIPIHYNFSGQADGWAGRSSFWGLAGVTLAFYVFLSLAERYPRRFNYPVRVTAGNAAGLYELGVRMMRRMKFAFVLLFAYIANSSVAAALGCDMSEWNRVVLPFFLVGVFVLLGFFCLKMWALRD